MAEQEQKNSDLTPQEIQRKYPDYEKLVESLKEVNVCLISFASQLETLIKGK